MASNTAPKKAQSKATKPAPGEKDAGIAAPVSNWERIELDYRAGIKTLRQIAGENGISEGAIRKRARKEEWTRDLSARIQEKAEQLVRKEAVRNEVRKDAVVNERRLIEVNAQAVAEIRLAHRSDIHRARNITNALLKELEQQTDPETLQRLRELGELMSSPDEKTGRDRLNELYQAVISLPERSKTMKTLAESLRSLVDMERTAFGMDKDAGNKDGDALANLIKTIASGNNSAFMPVKDDPERED